MTALIRWRRAAALALCSAVVLVAHQGTAVASANAGSGVLEGTVSFAAPGIPALDAPCQATSFSFTATSAAVVVNLAGTEYAGTLSLSGSGSSPCENTTVGRGAITVDSAAGVGPTGGTLSCGPLTGAFVRRLSDVSLSVSGSCTVNTFATGNVLFLARVEFLPSNPGGGLIAPVTGAVFAGAYVLAPA